LKLFKIPPDILNDLKREFPEFKSIEKFIDRLFEKIFRKTISDGSCAITRLGTFFSYKTYSNRLKKIVPRFKFSLSRALRNHIADDRYLLDQIQDVKEPSERVPYIEITGDKSGGRDRREAERNKKHSHIKSHEKVVQDEIYAILEESFNNDEN